MAQRQYDVANNAVAASTPANSAKGFFSDIVAESAGSSIGSSIVRVTVDDGNATTAAGTATGSMGGRKEILDALNTIIGYIMSQTYPDT